MRAISLAVIIALIANVGTIIYAGIALNNTIKNAVPFTVLEAQYYEVNKEKRLGKDIITPIGEGPKTAKLVWNNGRLDFVDGGLPMTEAARLFLIEAANTYNKSQKKPAAPAK